MNYLDKDELVELMGLGDFVGEVRPGPDGNLYQWIEDGESLGDLGRRRRRRRGRWRRIGRRVRKGLRRVLRRALPMAQAALPLVPHPGARAAAAGLTVATPVLRKAGIAGAGELGALYEAPDGSLYQVAGLAEDNLTDPIATDGMDEVYLGADGHLYQVSSDLDGLGGRRSRRRRRLRRRRLFRRLRRLGKRLRPVAKVALRAAASQIPDPAARQAATSLISAGRMGALYEAPDGSVYQIEGLAEGDLYGLADDDDLYGIAEPEDLYGFDEDDLYGLDDDEAYDLADDEAYDLADDDEDLNGYIREDGVDGLDDDEELYGLANDDDFEELEGYVEDDEIDGLEEYIPAKPASTRWFKPPAETPDIWKPHW